MKVKKVLKGFIPGGKGQVGSDVARLAKKYGFIPIVADLPTFDVTQKEAITTIFRDESPDIVINCAAYTAVDKAEEELETAFKVNQTAVRYLAESCKNADIPLLHISTDYVFSGDLDVPYKENHNTNPLGVYGHSKFAGEEEIRDLLEAHIILRTAWVYGVEGNNFIKTMLRVGQKNGSVRVVGDQFGSPTFARDIADTLLHMARKIVDGKADAFGTYHYTGGGGDHMAPLREKNISSAGRAT